MALTQTAFDLLLARLHPDRQRAAEEYELVRKKLIKFFEWQGSTNPDECADETIDRVAKRVGQGEEIHDLAKYFKGVARLIAFEIFKERGKQANLIRQLRFTPTTDAGAEREENQTRNHCMETCLHALSQKDFEVITRYYQPENKAENKKSLAEQIGIPLNALRIRAYRIREKLKKCYANCLRCEQGHEII